MIQYFALILVYFVDISKIFFFVQHLVIGKILAYRFIQLFKTNWFLIVYYNRNEILCAFLYFGIFSVHGQQKHQFVDIHYIRNFVLLTIIFNLKYECIFCLTCWSGSQSYIQKTHCHIKFALEKSKLVSVSKVMLCEMYCTCILQLC